MDHPRPKDEEFAIDLENGADVIHSTEDGGPEQKDFRKLSDQFMSIDDNLVKLSIIDPSTIDDGCPENILKVVIDSQLEVEKTQGKKMGKEKRKKASSAKKPPKPPRPPRGFSLDAADQKLIKEIAELAMMKRTHLKVLKQKKALKASSSSSSIRGSLFAMLFTVIFMLMILLQGTSYRNTSVTSQGSPLTAHTIENGLVFIKEQLNPSASDSILPHSKSSITGSNSASRKITVAE